MFKVDEIVDELMGKLEDVTDIVAEKAEGLLDASAEKWAATKEVVADTMKKSELEKELASAYIDLGGAVFEAYSDLPNSRIYKEFEDEIAAVKEANENLAQIEEKIQVFKGTKVCNNCGTEVSESAKYCPECGEAFDAEEEDETCCPNCRVDIEPGQKFCKECGHRLN